MDRTQQIAEAFDRLFRTYLQSDRDDPERLAIDRLGKASVYFEAVEDYDTADVLAALKNFGNGSAPGHNPEFIPSAPVVGAEARRVRNLRLDSEARDRALRPALPEPPIVRSPESRARVKAMADALGARLRSNDAAAAEQSQQRAMRVNSRLEPDMSDEAIRKRLNLGSGLGYSVGDPEGDEATR